MQPAVTEDADQVYNVSRNLERAKERLHEDTQHGLISADSEKLILQFLRDLDISNISKHRQYFYLERLRVVAKAMGEQFSILQWTTSRTACMT